MLGGGEIPKVSYLQAVDDWLDRTRRREEREDQIVEAVVFLWRHSGYAFDPEETLVKRARKFVRGEEID